MEARSERVWAGTTGVFAAISTTAFIYWVEGGVDDLEGAPLYLLIISIFICPACRWVYH